MNGFCRALVNIAVLALLVLVLVMPSNGAADNPLRKHWNNLDKSVLVWGSFTVPSSIRKQDANNAKFETYAKPTIRLWQLGENTKVTGYLIVAALRDKQKFDYDSKVKFGLGVELQHKLTSAVKLSFGARWDSEYRYFSTTTYSALVATADLSVYKSWKPGWLRKGRLSDARLVLSGWANLRYPSALDPSERHNGMVQGSLKLAVVVPIGKGKLKLAPFASILGKADLKGQPWNNTVEPALGIDLKIPLGKRGELSVGVKSALQLRHTNGEMQGGALGYLSWYKHF